ncbi:MAG: STAS/SEC14 domain-containing protein [Victivallales bacterium]|jgi:hypothetical protein
MLNVQLDEKNGIAMVEPLGSLSKDDFKAAAAIIDPYIEKNGHLNSVLVHAKSFPGWDSFNSLVKHLEFVKEHHKKVNRVAFVTDSPIGCFAEHVAGHFVKAAIRHFPFKDLEEAKNWIADSQNC